MAFNIFDSLLHKVADNIFVGGTVIIHNHSDNDSKISGVIHSVDIQQNIPATISESPPKTNIPENIPPVTVNQASKDTKPAVVPQASQDIKPVIVQTISNDTLAAKTFSKDSSPQEKFYRTELIYQFIIKHSDIFTRRKNESPAKISEDMKTFEPQKISHDIHAVTLSDDSAPENFTFTGWHKTRSSVDIPQASQDKQPFIVQEISYDIKPAVIQQEPNDTLPAETFSKDSSPQEKIDRTELIYQFIIKHSDIFTRRKNESPAKISEDMKTFEPQKISHDIHAVTLSDDSAPENFTFTGWLKTRSSVDTHSFTLTHSCAANISFTPSDGDKAYYVLTVRGDSGHVITRKTIDSENLHTGTGNIYLRPGNYTVNIERGYSWSGKPYRITVSTSRVSNAEQESNNSPQTANVIPLNKNVSASSGTHNDTDYFTFTLEKPMMIRPCLEFREVMNGRRVYDKKFYGLTVDDRNFVFRGDATPSRKIKPFVLDAGKYIISISRLEPEELELGLHEYTLRVDAQELM